MIMFGAQAAWGQDDDRAPSKSAAATQSAIEGATDEEAARANVSGNAELSGLYTDNFYYQGDTVPRRSAGGLLFKPKIRYTSVAPTFGFHAGAGMAIGKFSRPGTVDDYYDVEGNAGAQWQPAIRHHLLYDMHAKRGHDPFGIDRTENTPLENRSLDRWVNEDYHLTYRYGTPGGSFDFDGQVFATNKEFHTNRSFTQFVDHDTQGAHATFFYNYSPKTKFLADALVTHIHFDHDFRDVPNDPNTERQSRNGNDYKFHVGARWLATAKTTGDARVGYTVRDFQTTAVGTRPTFRGIDWQIAASWAPLTYRIFSISTGRTDIESYNQAGFIDSKYVNLSWTEDWTQRFKTTLTAGADFRRFANIGRSDDLYTGTIRGDYRMLTNLFLFGSYSYSNRNSTQNVFDYYTNTVILGLKVTF